MFSLGKPVMIRVNIISSFLSVSRPFIPFHKQNTLLNQKLLKNKSCQICFNLNNYQGRENLMRKVRICAPNIWVTSNENLGFAYLPSFWPHVVDCAPNLQQFLSPLSLFQTPCSTLCSFSVIIQNFIT